MISAMTWQGWLISVSALIDRHAGVLGQRFERRMAVAAQHDGIDHAAEHARGILDRFAAAQLHFAGDGDDAGAAQLPHAPCRS